MLAAPSYPTLNRRLPPGRKSRGGRRCRRRALRMPGWGWRSLVLYDVSTLYFETDRGDGFREPGFSKERRLEPQITIGLLTGQDGFPLMVSAFEGNKAETKTMLPVIEKFMAAHRLPDVTVVADAGMISEANQKAIEAAGPVVHPRHEDPRHSLPGRAVAARAPGRGHPRRARLHPALARRAISGSAATRSIDYQYRADRARRTLRGIDEQVAKAAEAVAGLAPVKRNRFIALDGAVKSVNRELEAKARDLAGLKGYVTNLAACTDGTSGHRRSVLGSTRLWNRDSRRRTAQMRPARKSWPSARTPTPLAKQNCILACNQYLIKEYARHLGHADLLRERIDGITGE